MRKPALYEVIDVELVGSCGERNPFAAAVRGIFIGPDGERLIIPGFYAGAARWIVRFSPTKIGPWRYEIESDLARTESPTSGSIDCVAAKARSKGPIAVSTENPFHFQYPDGSYHFMNAYECDWL